MPNAPTNADSRPSQPVVRSRFADDPAFAPLLRMLVESLPEKGAELRQLLAAGDDEGLARLAHQIKGAGGGYGFPELSDLAGALEDACRDHRTAEVAPRVDRLLAFLQRMRA